MIDLGAANELHDETDLSKGNDLVSGGVTVAQGALDALVGVQIPAGQMAGGARSPSGFATGSDWPSTAVSTRQAVDDTSTGRRTSGCFITAALRQSAEGPADPPFLLACHTECGGRITGASTESSLGW